MKAARNPKARTAETPQNVESTVPQGELFGVSRGEHALSFTAPSPLTDTGPQRRDRGQRQVASAPYSEPWLSLAADAIDVLCARGTAWTAEDVRRLAGEPPRANLCGVAIRRAKLSGLITTAGVDYAERAEARGRLIQTWTRRGRP